MPQDMKESAHNYWQQGLNVVLLNGKKPLHDWAKWQTERQTLRDFEALPWNEADGFALIGGTKLENGLFFGAVDFDVKNVSEKAEEKGKQALKCLPITQIEETPSGGQHWIYLCRSKPKTINAYHNECALELIGEGKLCIMAPSEGYKRLNDNSPAVIDDLEAIFYNALEQIGIKNGQQPQNKVWFNRNDLTAKSYTGKNPPCINALFRGATQGERNEYGIRLASYMLNFRGLNPNYAFKRLKEWNRFNSPPLPEKEMENIVKSAAKGNYIYGCEDEILRRNCDAEECPMAVKTKHLTPQQADRAEKLLSDPKLLEYVLAYGRKRLIGEDNVLVLNFVAICSGQTKYPISAILSGFSGSGKNESIRAIKPLIPEKWIFDFTTSTPEAIKYIGEDFNGTIIIYEAEGVKGETGSLGLRAIGESESIETIYPVRNELTGKMELGKAKTNARNFITTETSLEIHPDLYRRVFKYEMNHSLTLTKRVLAKKLRDAALPESLKKLLGDQISQIPYSEEDFKNALWLNDWKAEVIMFPPSSLMRLLDLAVTKEQKVALRTHVEKILNFVRVLALINQRRRLRLKVGDKNYVIASPEDFQKAFNVLQTTIKETVTRLGKRQQEVLSLFNETDTLDKHKVAEKLGISTDTAARALKSLAKAGYLKENTVTKPYNYELMQKEPNPLGILENPSEYNSFWRKSLEKLLKSISATLQSKGIVFQILEPENQRVTLEPSVLNERNMESSLNFASSFETLMPPECRVAEVPITPNPSPITENNQKYLGFSSIPKENRLFLWRRIKPAEKCELCGKHAVEYEINDVKNRQILRRCQSCFESMRHAFSNSAWKNVGGLDFGRQNQSQNDDSQVKVS